MSDRVFSPAKLLSAMPKSGGFVRRDYGSPTGGPVQAADDGNPSDAFAAGFDEGHRVASEAAATDRTSLLAMLEKASVLQPEASDELAALIAETVFALVKEIVCSATIDAAALEKRIAAAVALISECDAARTLFLHPEDAALVSGSEIPLTICPDATLARGDLRIDCSAGWIEHGSSIFLDALRSELGAAA
jgi:flagellar assembly protein FliH